MEFLSDDWLAAVSELAAERPPAPGVTGIVSVSVAVAPRREVRYHWRYDRGVPGDGAAGASDTATLTLSLPAEEARSIIAGEVEPSVSFMRGRLKAAGDGAALLALLASTGEPAFGEWRKKLAAITE